MDHKTHKYNVSAEVTIFVLLNQAMLTIRLQKVHMLLMTFRISVRCLHRTLVLQSQSALYCSLLLSLSAVCLVLMNSRLPLSNFSTKCPTHKPLISHHSQSSPNFNRVRGTARLRVAASSLAACLCVVHRCFLC